MESYVDEFDQTTGQLTSHDGTPCFEPEGYPVSTIESEELSGLIDETSTALRELSDTMSKFKNPPQRVFKMREAIASCALEGNEITIYDFILNERSSGEKAYRHNIGIHRAMGYTAAVDRGIAQMFEVGIGQLDMEYLNEIHDTLTVREEVETELRDSCIYFGSDATHPDYIPSNPDYLEETSKRIINTLNLSGYGKLPSIAIAHYYVNAICPYRGENRRLSCALTNIQLTGYDLIDYPILDISTYFNDHKEEYEEKLLAVSKKGEWNEWVEFMFEGIIAQAKTVTRNLESLEELIGKIKTLYEGSPIEQDIAFSTFGTIFADKEYFKENTDYTDEEIESAIEQLESDNVFKKITQDPACYVVPEIEQLVVEGSVRGPIQ